MRQIFLVVVTLTNFTSCATAPGNIPSVSGPALPMTSPGNVGMSKEGIARISKAMQAYVDDGRLPGVMMMIARGGKIVHWDAIGMRDIETGHPLEPDDIFRIYSMTKPITSTAVMMLVEQGEIALDDPVSKFIPAFADPVVLAEDGQRSQARRPITIRHLLSHTGGLTYGFFGNTAVDKIYLAKQPFNSSSLEEFVDKVAGLPLLAQPGERWNYSVSTDILGYIVQVASGQTLDAGTGSPLPTRHFASRAGGSGARRPGCSRTPIDDAGGDTGP